MRYIPGFPPATLLFLLFTFLRADILFSQVKPNIVVILSDDQGYADISFNPHHPVEVNTPHMDSLANEGIFFSQAYTSGNTCSPTRAGLITGRYQHRAGIYDSGEGGSGLPLEEKIFPQFLKPAGYVCGAFGKWHLGLTPEYNAVSRGFDEFFGFMGRGAHDYYELDNPESPLYRGLDTISATGYLTNLLTEEAIDFIRRHKEQSFFCYLAYNAVHSPAQAPAEDIADFNTGDSTRNILMAMLRHLDNGVGQVVRTLKEEGVWDNTLLIFLTDNGGSGAMHANNAPLRDFKQTNWEGGIRTPFVFSWPAKYQGGRIVETPVISLDILPTVMDAAGLDEPVEKPFDGKSILPLLEEDAGPHHDMLFWTEGGIEGEWAVRYGMWKLVVVRDSVELFDLDADISETTNLKDIYPDTVEKMIIAFEEWLDEMAEPNQIPSKRWSPDLASGQLMTLYDGLYYQGGSQSFSETGIYNADGLSGIGNNRSRSVALAPGYDALGYSRDSLSGDDFLITGGIPFLGEFDNSLSSVILYPEGSLMEGSIEIRASESESTAQFTRDRDLSTYWDSKGDDEWIQYAFCNEINVKGIRIAFKRGHLRVAYFNVEVSMDGSSWTPVITGGESSGTRTSLELFSFPEVRAKYVRIVGFGNSDNAQNHYTEVEFDYSTDEVVGYRIEAEDYSQANGMVKIISGDCRGFLDMDATMDGAWADYAVDLPAGATRVEMRLKILQTGSIDILADHTPVTNVAVDGSMVKDNYQTISYMVDIPRGTETLGLKFNSPDSGSLCHINWLELSGSIELYKQISYGYPAVRVFPNPCKHQLNIVSPENLEQVWLYDQAGKMIFTEKTRGGNFILSTTSLKSGFYMIRIQHARGVEYLKIIKS
jgi:arylsulfatase A-like enzyme